jgi:hypothetical protein
VSCAIGLKECSASDSDVDAGDESFQYFLATRVGTRREAVATMIAKIEA